MKKVETLFPTKVKDLSTMNIFEKEMLKKEVETTSGNDSIKFATSGNIFVDDFAAIGNYRSLRDFDDIFATMDKLCNQDRIMALKLTVYIRVITRAPFFKGHKLGIQRGQGLKHEYIGRLWYFINKYPDMFYRNLDVFVAAGSWNDLFEILRTDLYYNGRPTKKIFDNVCNYITKNLSDKNQADLIKKYLPQIKPSKKCTTLRTQANNIIAKTIATMLYPEMEKASAYACYRHLKTSGNAHTWEQKISQQKYNEIDFSLVAGRALAWMVKSKFLKNHELEKAYEEWIASQPIAKFTGYVYELFKPIQDVYCSRWDGESSTLKPYQIMTLNKQFDGLIETAKQNMNRETSFICCIDTSGSMISKAKGTGVSSLGVARSIALYFSELLEGKFKNTFLEFESTCTFNTWKGNTAYEKWIKTPISGYCGSTNFLSVADTLCDLKRKGYQESEFPTGIICISDGEFDQNIHWSNYNNGSTFESFLRKLRNAGFSDEFVDNFKIVLWDIPNGYYGSEIRPKFEGLADRPNFYYMSGLDPAGIAFLTGTTYTQITPKTAEELFEAAMNQELIQKIK